MVVGLGFQPRRSNAPGLSDRSVRPVKVQQRTSGGASSPPAPGYPSTHTS